MTKEFYDIAAVMKKEINERFAGAGRKATELSKAGKLKVIEERMLDPFDGYGFELDKGQVIRYELTHGPQIIDTTYLVRSRPTIEFADIWMTAVFGSMVYDEGATYLSNTPFCRPLLTLIRDTCDVDAMRKKYGELAGHNFFAANGRCTASQYETMYGTPHHNSCDSNLMKGIFEVAGEDVARALQFPPGVFMHFQIIAYDKVPTAMSYFSGQGSFKKGDYVELLAHEDLYAIVSMCPMGDQHDMTLPYNEFANYPIKVAILEGEDGPLETQPDPGLQSHNAVDWIKDGRPGMVVGKTVTEEQF